MLKENIHQVEQSNSEINTVSASTMPSEESAGWELSRRGLFTAAGACAVSSMVGGCASLIGQPESALKSFHASCTMECIHCHLKAEVKDGKVVKITSDNPYDGKACARGLSRIKWMYAKNRVLTPLKRVGEKGEGKFEPMTWDEALDLIVSKMKEAIAKDGSQSILFSAASGNMDSFANPTMGAFGAYLGGVTDQIGSLCCGAVTSAMVPMFGKRYVDTRDTIADAKLIVAWGTNPMVSMQAYWKRYLAAKEKGAKLIVIDPRRSETAARADQWIPINPGTDVVLALGMIRVMAHEKLLNTEFLKAHTGATYLVDKAGKLLREDAKDKNSYLVYDLKSKAIVRHDKEGIDPALDLKGIKLPKGSAAVRTVLSMLLAEAEVWTPEKVETETRIPVKVMTALAREYATSPAAMIIENMGSFQRIEMGSYAAACHLTLAALTGQVGRAGTGVCDAGGVGQMAKFGSPIPAPAKKPQKFPGLPKVKFGEWVPQDKPCKINVYYTQTCAPVGSWPNTNAVIKALKHIPFVVVADSLMTPTAKFADVVLPVTTLFEYESLLAGQRTHFVQWSDKAVEPQGVAKPDYWIWAQLAKRMGFGEAFDLTPDKMAENVLKPSGIKLEDVKKAPVCPVGDKAWIPYEGGVFATPTKKAHFYVEAWAEKGYSPVLHWYRPVESPKGNPTLAKRYPLQAIQRKVIRNIHTCHQNNEWLREVFPNAPVALINRADAQVRGISDKEMVVVFNDRGEHRARAILSDNIISGTISLENGWWFGVDGFVPSSVRTNDTVEPLSHASTICSTLVDVRPEGAPSKASKKNAQQA